MFHPKKLIAILSLSTLMLTPFSPPSHLTGADAAMAAKGGNGGGNGVGNGSNKDSSGSKSSTGKSTGNSEPSGSKKSSSKAKAASETSPGKNGNMNGALHASPKAILAHIRNGSTNGPVGSLAALIVASSAAPDPADLAQMQETYAKWSDAFDAALEQSGFEKVDDYDIAKQASIDAFKQYDIDFALWQASIGTDDELSEPVRPIDFTVYEALETPAPPLPSAEDIAAQQSLTDAKLAVLALWNKNPDADPATISTQEQALLDSLLGRFSQADLAAFAEAAN